MKTETPISLQVLSCSEKFWEALEGRVRAAEIQNIAGLNFIFTSCERTGPSVRAVLTEIYLEERSPWTGEGLPPVGTVCEYRVDGDNWRECVVIAHHADLAVCWIHCNKIFSTNGTAVRHIRKPEQIAAEERKAGIDEMKDVFDSNFEGCRRDGLEALWDAGYRKQVQP